MRVPTRRLHQGPQLPAEHSDWLTAWAALWSLPDLPSRIHLAYSLRLRRALGRCTPRTGSIRLNLALHDTGIEILREVICHEAAHIAAWALHGPKTRAHGSEWKALMRLAGYEPRARWAKPLPNTDHRSHRHNSQVFIHSCPICGARWAARRQVTTWRCTTCRNAGLEGQLEISTRPAATEAQ